MPPATVGPAAVSALAAILVYAITLGGIFVYDDIAIVRDDPRVRNPALWSQLWTKDYFNGGIDNLYRPIVSCSYALEWFIHGDRPWIFHAVNILLHALAAAGVAEFTRRALGAARTANSAALAAGLLFAVHPVHVEAVANIVGRAELACTAAVFAGLVILCRRPIGYGRIIAAIGCAIIALLCKEQGILQPLLWVFFGMLIWRFQPVTWASGPCRAVSKIQRVAPSVNHGPEARVTADASERQVVKLWVLITCWTWTIYIVVREHFLRFEWDRSFSDPVIQPMLKCVGIDRILMPVVLVGHCTALLLWPIHLSPDYGADVIGSVVHRTDPYLWIGVVAIVGWLLSTVTAWFTRSRLILFCLVCFAVTYGLIGNILTLIGTIFAERLLYLPSAFFVIIVGVLLARLPRPARLITLVLLVGLGSVRTITGARDWNQPMLLFQHALATHPKSLQLHFLLAQQYHQHGDEPAAAAVLADATSMYHGYWEAWMHRSLQAMDTGHLKEAREYLNRAIQVEHNPALLGPQARLRALEAAATSRPVP